jgi:SpoVK/Ycf46/Vps4 family AAA+-type ATPase
VTALFSGASGTGKTLAAEVLAAELGLDLHRIDLAGVVSKYIGETEKNLDRVFQAAENANAVLLFDEADALFGKRSAVRDSHDRYANLEISYLLQKMEEYDGLAILSTNLRDNIDPAFLRRLAFVVTFPFPEEDERLRIWSKIWPPGVTLAEDVELEPLAEGHRLSGGQIRNVALSAAYLAAADGQMVSEAHLDRALRREYGKTGRDVPTIPNAEAVATP